jgi:hypothetical protein
MLTAARSPLELVVDWLVDRSVGAEAARAAARLEVEEVEGVLLRE